MADIILRNHQINHINHITNITTNSFYAIDTSPTGSGKTITTLYLAKQYNMKLLILCPANVMNHWKVESTKYGINNIILSYTKLVGKKTCNHPYLTRDEDRYLPTSNLLQLIQEKIMVVYDESQKGKNPSALTLNACHTISNEIVKANNGSRIMILSATIIDKPIYAESVLKMSGIITTKELFIYDLPRNIYYLEGYGYNQVIDYCKILDEPITNDITKKVNINAKHIRNTLYDLLSQIIKYHTSSAMPLPDIPSSFIGRISYYKLPQDESNKLSEAIAWLKKAVHYENGDIKYEGSNFAEITLAHKAIEVAKVNLFIRLAKKKLDDDVNNKVIMYLWYKDPLYNIADKLSEYKPIILNGDIDINKRTKMISLFMEHNNNYRLILSHPLVGGIGISLDDTHGNYPRTIYISPSFKFMDIHQCAGRIYRTNTKSNAYVNLVNGQDNIEHIILKAIARKTDIVKGMCLNNNIVYPGDYPVYVE